MLSVEPGELVVSVESVESSGVVSVDDETVVSVDTDDSVEEELSVEEDTSVVSFVASLVDSDVDETPSVELLDSVISEEVET